MVAKVGVRESLEEKTMNLAKAVDEANQQQPEKR